MFLILRRLFRREWAACLGALLFALHPVQVESVAWISGLKDLLAGLFSLAAILAYLHAHPPSPKQARRAYVTAALLLIAALLSKPSAVVTPLIAAAIDLLVLHRPLRQILLPIGVALLLCVPILVITRLVQPAAMSFQPPIWSRPLIATDALAFYLQKLLAPIHLAIDYGRSPKWLHSSRQLYLTWMIPAATGLAIFLARGRLPSLAAGAAVFVAALLPVLGFVSFDFQGYSTTADHYLYLAMLGPAIMLAGLLTKAAETGVSTATAKRALTLAVSGLLIALAIRATLQTWHWADSQRLFEHTLAVNPDSLAGNVNLGRLYADDALASAAASEQARNRGEVARAADLAARSRQAGNAAIKLLLHAVEHFPDDYPANLNLGNVYYTQGRFDKAFEHYSEALRIQPDSAEAQKGIDGIIKMFTNRLGK